MHVCGYYVHPLYITALILLRGSVQVMTVIIPYVAIHSFSTEPRAKKKEYVVPLIKQNNWRLPVNRNQTEGGDEGSGVGDPSEKSDGQLSLEEEAAQAIIQGEQMDVQPEAALRCSNDEPKSIQSVIIVVHTY